MKITDLLKRESVELSGTPESKGQAIDQMVELMAKGGNINDLQRYKEGVLKREEEGTTGIGEGIAIPHAKTDAVSAPGLAAMLVPQGVDYDALDGQPVHMIFLIAAPNTEENVHLEVLSRLSMLLMDDEFRKNLLDAADATEFTTVPLCGCFLYISPSSVTRIAPSFAIETSTFLAPLSCSFFA